MILFRRLSAYEEFLQSPREDQRFNFCLALGYAAPSYSHFQLEKALAYLQSKHKLLQVGVTRIAKTPYFYNLKQKHIPLDLIYAKSKNTWFNVVQDEIHEPFDHSRGPLARVKHVISNDLNYILVTFDHLIADGVSGSEFVLELFECLESNHVFNCSQNVEKTPKSAQGCDLKEVNSNQKESLSHNYRKSNTLQTGCLYAKINTSSLIQSAQENMCSIQAVLLTCGLIAIRKNIEAMGPLEMIHESSINLRRYAPNTLTSEGLNCLFGIIKGKISLENHLSPQRLVGEISNYLKETLKTNLLDSTLASVKDYMNECRSKGKLVSGKTARAPICNALIGEDEIPIICTISNLGVIDNKHKITKIKNFYVFVATHGRLVSNNSFHVLANTFNDELFLTFSYPKNSTKKVRAKKVFQDMLNLLKTFVTQSMPIKKMGQPGFEPETDGL